MSSLPQTYNEPEHTITDKGKNHYGNEKTERNKKDTLENLTIQKLRSEVEKLVNELSDYPTTKARSIWSLRIAIAAVIIAALTLS